MLEKEGAIIQYEREREVTDSHSMEKGVNERNSWRK